MNIAAIKCSLPNPCARAPVASQISAFLAGEGEGVGAVALDYDMCGRPVPSGLTRFLKPCVIGLTQQRPGIPGRFHLRPRAAHPDLCERLARRYFFCVVTIM